MAKVYNLAAAMFLLAFLAGCASSNGRGRPVAGRGVDRGQNPNQMVKNAVDSRASLSSLTGKGVMRIVDQPSKFGLTVNADIVADDSDRLRIRADKLAGTIQAFDVVMLQDDIGFYVPTQKTLYHGKVKDLQNFSFKFDPEAVLQQMLRPDDSLVHKKWRSAEGQNESGAIILDEDVPEGQPRLRLAISNKNGMIASVTQLDPKGQAVFVKRFDDYRTLTQGKGGSGGKMSGNDSVFPFTMAFSWPRERRSMEMNFKQVDPNAPVRDEDFDLATSADTRQKPLREAQMDPGLSDEPVAARPREPTKRGAM